MKWRSIVRAVLLLSLIFAMAPGLGAADLEDGYYARIETAKGDIVARLFYIRVPITVANFVGLAEGTKPWRGSDGKSRTTRFYDGLTFHRVVRNFMIQGGDPEGTGRGGPGYSFVDEFHPDLKHDKPGILSMANSGANTNGSQFFITLVPTPWLNNRHSVFGEVVEGRDAVNAIANGDAIRHVTILRIGAKAKAFDLEKTAQAKLRLLARQFGQKEKILPEPGPPVDPARVPQPGQQPVDKVGLEYFIVHYRGAQVQMAPLIYSDREAKAIAERFSALARAKNADFSALAKIYSDFDRQSIWTIDADNPRVPPYLRDVFTLKVGQVSDPIRSPVGWLVVRRVGIDTVAVSHILVSWRGAGNATTGRTKKEARAIVEKIVSDLRAGGAFVALVKQYSDDPTTKEKGGRIGELARGQTEPAFDRAAFALKPGEISRIVQTSFGFHVIRREP